jgi:polysaccharide export outer membrane protein
MFVHQSRAALLLLTAMTVVAMLGGCAVPGGPRTQRDLNGADVPRELQKVTLPPYVVEPPDILLINVIRALPKPPYRIQTLDVLYIEDNFQPPAMGEPDSVAKYRFTGNYSVEPGGTIDMGPEYGRVQVGNLTTDEARVVIQRRIDQLKIKDNMVRRVSLTQMSGVQQQVQGEHLVALDGTISLGTYGRVHVTGMTLDEVRYAVENHLSAFLDAPQVSVDVFAYNSKVYYVITQGTVSGDAVIRLPATGNETVLDAISQVQGLQPHSSRFVWVARPAPPGSECADQVLPVDWLALTKMGATSTNYQVFPGDRIYVSEDPWITLDGGIAKIQSPFERMMGFTILGTGMVRGLRFFHQQGCVAGGGCGGGF